MPTNPESLIITQIDKKSYYKVQDQTRKHIFYGYAFCFSWMFLFLICLYLIPYNPIIQLYNLKCNDNNCLGSFKFINNNYYKTYWNDPKLSLYWVPYNNQSIGSSCYKYSNCPNCLIKIGNFQNTLTNDNFNIDSKSNKIKEFSLINSTKMSCINWIQLNPYKNLPERFLATGHINVKTDLNNYGKINVKRNYYLMKK